MPTRCHLWWPRLIVLLLVLSGIFPAGTEAAKRALLVGVSDYMAPGIRPLQGPRHDVAALRMVLSEQFGFAADHITTLLDHQATRRQILQALERLRDVSKPGDFVLFYFSGHGTSAFDVQLNLPLPHNTGAFVPADFAMHGSTDEKMASLLLGSRDIRPILTALDAKQVPGMIIIDSCFSQNTSRAVHASARRPVYRSLTSGLEHLEPFDTQPKAKQPYPYRHLVTLAAASSKEPAIDEENIYQTLDGKPHGAFTDSLLRSLREIGNADMNHDGTVTNWELFAAIKTRMSAANYPHSPQMLPLHTEDHSGLEARAVFGERLSQAGTDTAANPAVRLRVQVHGTFPLVSEVIKQTPGLSLATEPYDLRVARVNHTIHLLTAFGDAVVESDDERLIAQALRQQLWIKQLLTSTNAAQRFRIELRMDGYCGETFEEGDILEFSVTMDQTAYFLMVDVAPDGNLRLLYPTQARELAAVPARQPLRFGNIQVNKPFGMDYVVAVGFINKPSVYDARLLQETEVVPDTHRYHQLQAMLHAINDANQARHVVKVVTVPRRSSPRSPHCN